MNSVLAKAQSVPAQLLPEDVAGLGTAAEKIEGRFPGLLVAHPGKWSAPDRDGHTYNTTCAVYIAAKTPGIQSILAYNRRFLVHAPEASQLPIVKRVARLLLLLLGEARERLHYDHPSNPATVEVWLTGEPAVGATDAGGQQLKNEIYLFDLTAERTSIEWTREIAHEYGHFSLPGVSGFTAPEDWANGVLGERLYQKWLNEDLHAGRLHPEEIPFVSPAELDDYVARQVAPLVRRIQHEGVEPRLFSKKDAAGMDYYTAFALYLDSVYGSSALLNAMSYTTPREGSALIQAPDFYRGALDSLSGATELTLTVPYWTPDNRAKTFPVFIPRGNYTVALQNGARSWQFAPEAKDIHPQQNGALQVTVSGWQRLTLTGATGQNQRPRLALTKPGAEVP